MDLMCSLHNKKRSVQYLEENQPGVYFCRPGFECKGGGAQDDGLFGLLTPQDVSTVEEGAVAVAAGATDEAADMVVCAEHMKTRYRSHVTAALGSQGEMVYVCVEPFRCKLTGDVPLSRSLVESVQRPSNRFSPYPLAGRSVLPPRRGPTATPVMANTAISPQLLQQAQLQALQPLQAGALTLDYAQYGGMLAPMLTMPMSSAAAAVAAWTVPSTMMGGQYTHCAKHNKQRSMQSLEVVDGQLQCKASMACKTDGASRTGQGTGGSTIMCSLHNKMRSAANLTFDATTSTYYCTPAQQCK